MKIILRSFIALSTLLLSTSLFARPASESVKEVLDYYYQGQGQGAVLVEAKLCQDIVREGENKNECKAEISTLKQGDSAYVWMKFMVPQGDKVSNILLQADSGGLTRDTQTVDLVGSFRYRTWKQINFSKPGEWSIKVIEDGAEPQVLTTITATVN